MKLELNIHQERALKEFKDIWNDVEAEDEIYNVKTDEEAINLCIAIAAMFMRHKEARTAFYMAEDI